MNKRNIIIFLFSISTLGAYAIERNYMEGYTIEPSAINTSESEGGLSLLKNKLAFSRGGKIYVATLNDSLDISDFKEQKDLSELGIEGQFAQYNNQLYYSNQGTLYCVTLKNNVWGNPQKLLIDGYMSTREQEEGVTFISRRWTYKKKPFSGMYNPAIGNKGKRIYFSSEIDGGKGGRDIWYIDRKADNKTWSAPKNMTDVNSEGEEDFPQLIGDTAFYFSSTRKDTLGGVNIFKKFMKKQGGAEMIPADFNSGADDKNFIVAEKCPFLISNRGGGDDIYRPNVKAPEPIVEAAPIDTTPVKVVRKDFNTCIFYFEFDKSTMIETYEKEFKYIYEFINEDSTSTIQITGHTDERGTDEYNKQLSHERASVVYDQLIKMGIDKKRLSYDGAGKTHPAVPNAQTEEEHQKNRRVEIIKQDNPNSEKQ